MNYIIHPQPQNNELISSYMDRLSKANMFTRFALLSDIGMVSEKHSIVKCNINTAIDEESLTKLSNRTGFPIDRLKAMTASRYADMITAESGQSSRWHLSNSYWFNATRIKVCPFCFKENNYYRIHWKLQLFNACIKHKVILIDKCHKCGIPIRDVSEKSRVIHEVGKCQHCGYEFARSNAVSISDDKIGLAVQKRTKEILDSEQPIAIGKRKYISKKDFLSGMRVLFHLISRLDFNSSLIHKIDLGKTEMIAIEELFNMKAFNTFKGEPSTKIMNVGFNYIVFVTAFKILLFWPRSFYRLLDGLFDIQSKEESTTRNRVFGLVQSTHVLLAKKSPQFIREVYFKWIKSKAKDITYFQNKHFAVDAHLYRYSDMVYSVASDIKLEEMPLVLRGNIWKRIEGFFQVPDIAVGSGNFYRRSISKARTFAAAYLYKLASGCSWSEVPAVRQGLVSVHGIHQRLTILRKRKKFDQLTSDLISSLNHMR